MHKHNSNGVHSVSGIFIMTAILILLGIASNSQAITSIKIYKSKELTISTHQRFWCSRGIAKLDARYEVSHLKRDEAFAGNYEQFVLDIVTPIILKHCKDPNFYKEGPLQYFRLTNYGGLHSISYDSIDYDLNEFVLTDNGTKHPKRIRHLPNKEHALNLKVRPMKTCSDKPFCDLPAGIYLNAIYENNPNLVRKIGRDKSNEVKQFMRRKSGGLSSRYITDVTTLFKGLNPPLIRTAINKYMHDYQYMSGTCFKQGADTKTFRYDTPDLLHTDEWGVTSREKGVHYRATYRVNPEFFPIRDRVASASASGPSSNKLQDLSPTLNQVYKGIEAIRAKMDCNSAEVKQFERNFLEMATQYINNPRAWESGRISRTQSSRGARSAALIKAKKKLSDIIQNNKDLGAKFLEENKQNDGVVVTSSGLQYIILRQGSGAYPKPDDILETRTRASTIDGTEISNSYGYTQPHLYIRKLKDSRVKGFIEGLQLIREGGKIRLFIPSEMAWWEKQSFGVAGPGSTVIFETELIRIH